MKAPTPLRLGRSIGYLCGGLLVWAGVFLVSYIVAALACARGFAHLLWFGVAVVPIVLLATAAAGLAALYAIARRADRLQDGVARRADDDRHVVAHVALIVCGLALVALVWNALAVALTGLRC